jgi:hypothetical protein
LRSLPKASSASCSPRCWIKRPIRPKSSSSTTTRWRIETHYRELKQGLLGGELTLRSRTPQSINQELYGALIAYNLVRLEMAHAAAEAGCAPTDLSFTLALHLYPVPVPVAGDHQPLELVLDISEARA